VVDKAQGKDTVKVFTRKELEEATGASSTTIHFYLRNGLLPRPQKTSYSRSLYTEEHLNILKKIIELKQAGLSLADIESQVSEMVSRAAHSKIDVIGQERERVRNRILAVATKEFGTKGYSKTHVADIIRKVRVTPSVLYGYFSSKRVLLLECVRVLMSWSLKYVDSKQATARDSAERVLWLIFGHGNVFKLGSAALSLARVEGTQDDKELHKPLQHLFDNIIEHYAKELRGMGGGSEGETRPIPEELLAHSLFGAHEQTMFRQQVGKKYSRKDAFMTHLWLFLAVQAAWSGEVDIDSRAKQYEDLVAELANQMPPMPPELENELAK
jgi:DNA-binding transcriptional MerR regulator